MGLAARTLRIHKGEGRLTALVVGLMFFAMVGITIGESGIEALFFDRVGAQALPVMYLLQGGTTFVAMLALTSGLGMLGPRRAYLVAPLALGGVVVAERAMLFTDAQWIYFVLWVTVAVATLVQAIFLWGTADAVIDTRQAKRLFPIFGAGGILGSVIGGLLTRPLASIIGIHNLLLVWAGGLGVAFALTRPVLGSPPAAGRQRAPHKGASALRDMAREFAFIRRSSMLVWMTVAAVLFSVLFYLLYLPYAQAASQRFSNPDELAGFFGLFWAANTGVAFLVSMLVTSRLISWFGVAAVVIVLALLYTTAFGVLLVASGFLTLVALRFAIGTWLQGVASPGWEALTHVLPESRRDQTRAFLNGGPVQIGTVIAGVIALVGHQTLPLRQFAAIGLVGAVLTIITTIGIRRSYIGALVDALRAGRPQVFQRAPVGKASVALAVDADSTRLLAESARSPDVRERRLAFQLLAQLPVQARPFEVLAGVEDHDPIVREAAIRALDLSMPGAREALALTIEDPDPAVAAAAAARAVGGTDDARPMSRLQALLTDLEAGVRRAAVHQLTLAPADTAAGLAWALVDDSDAQVRAAALEAIVAAVPDRGLEPALAGLQDPDPLVRTAAGRALGSMSGRGVEHVLHALDDPRTLEAAIEAVRGTELNGDHDKVRAFIRSAAGRATADHQLAAVIPDEDDAAALVRDAIVDRGRRVARTGLWAATMLGIRRAEKELAIENLDGTPAQLANALEALETAGDPDLRPLLALWEQGPVSRRDNNWLARALDDEDAFIRRCAMLVRARRQGVSMPGSVAALSVLERLLFLRKVPLFADLAPEDLERVAERAQERGFADGEMIAAEGEAGDELHIVIEGIIRVVHGSKGSGQELARRTAGDVVGEMSLISHAPRIASLVADGSVRTIRLGHQEFESMLHERPGIALALLRVLANRLAEAEHRLGSATRARAG